MNVEATSATALAHNAEHCHNQLICNFQVADDGSWLDVGTSVAHYAISTSLVMSLLLLYVPAKLLVTVNIC